MAKVTQLQLDLPKGLSKSERMAIADLAIEFIVERTQKGLNARGKPFPGYSKSYMESLDFENSGKSKGKVDLQLSGDMLAALEVLRDSSSQTVIGYSKGSEEEGRAEGNILGTYGQSSPIKGKARPFLGIFKKDLDKIIEMVRADHAGEE